MSEDTLMRYSADSRDLSSEAASALYADPYTGNAEKTVSPTPNSGFESTEWFSTIVNGLTIKEALKIRDLVDMRIEEIKRFNLVDWKANVMKQAKEFGLSIVVEDSKPKAKTKSKILPKYANPDNYRETWSGRGKRPKWLVKQLENEVTIESMLIKREGGEAFPNFAAKAEIDF